MFALNQVFFIGNLGGDAEIKNTTNGKQFAQLNVATTEKWTDRNSGEKKERTEWHRVIVWNEWDVKTASKLKKGNQVIVLAEQCTRKWEKDGVTHYTTENVLRNFNHRIGKIEWLGSDRQNAPDPTDGDFSTKSAGQKAQSGAPADLDDEIPF